MAILTPGLVYISRILAFLGLFSYAAATSRRLLEQHASIVAPTWLFVTVSAVILPGLITCRVLYKDWKLRREAARLGARIAPKWRGSWVGNLDHLRLMMQNFWTGYPGAFTSMIFRFSNTHTRIFRRWPLGSCRRAWTCFQHKYSMGRYRVHDVPRTHPDYFGYRF